MIRCSVTVSLVPEARGGPFVFWDDLEAACRKTAELGFDGIEVFPPSAGDLDTRKLRTLLDECGLQLAAVGTGAGWVKQRLHLCLPDADARHQARNFIRAIIDAAGPLGAPAIIGSMQGRSGDQVDAATAKEFLIEALNELGEHARQFNVPLLIEPINRYESNLVNSLAQGVELLSCLSTNNVALLADLFHMNIEDIDIADSLRAAGARIGHVHFVDSNRRPAGLGHLDFAAVSAALREIGYDKFLSAEALPYPNSDEAARQTISSFRKHFRSAV